MRTLPVSKAAAELGLEEILILAPPRLCSGLGGPLIHVMALLLGLKSSHMDLMACPIMHPIKEMLSSFEDPPLQSTV